jgi:hypothetical protein
MIKKICFSVFFFNSNSLTDNHLEYALHVEKIKNKVLTDRLM